MKRTQNKECFTKQHFKLLSTCARIIKVVCAHIRRFRWFKERARFLYPAPAPFRNKIPFSGSAFVIKCWIRALCRETHNCTQLQTLFPVQCTLTFNLSFLIGSLIFQCHNLQRFNQFHSEITSAEATGRTVCSGSGLPVCSDLQKGILRECKLIMMGGDSWANFIPRVSSFVLCCCQVPNDTHWSQATISSFQGTRNS